MAGSIVSVPAMSLNIIVEGISGGGGYSHLGRQEAKKRNTG
jgi:hypothetical protein